MNSLRSATETHPRIEVDWGDWEKAHSPTELFTVGLGICIGITLYDPAEKTGYMAHVLGTERSQAKVIPPFLKAVKAGGHDMARMLGWLSGGSVITRGTTEHQALRTNALTEVVGAGISRRNLEIEWNRGQFDCADIALRCNTGHYRLIHT